MLNRVAIARSAAMGALVLGAAWWLLPPLPQLWERALSLPSQVWLLATAGMLVSYALRASRLKNEWGRDLPMLWHEALHVTLLHSAAVNLLPLRAGELGYPWLMHKNWGISVKESAASLFWLRLQDATVIACLAWVAWGPEFGLPADTATFVRAILAATLVAVLASEGADLAARGLERLNAQDRDAIRRATPWAWLIAGVHRILQAGLRSQGRGWMWTCANWLIKLAVLSMLLQALVGLPLNTAWHGALTGELVAATPVQPPAGFGTYEAGVWAGVQLNPHTGTNQTVDSTAVLGAALTVHLFVLAISAFAALTSLALLRPVGHPQRIVP